MNQLELSRHSRLFLLEVFVSASGGELSDIGLSIYQVIVSI
jgi:hypothetical protein